jgi:alkylation response protein AidB-like acyl-CoA dehydrogenase
LLYSIFRYFNYTPFFPVLARIEGDPEGTRGISIFIVPKFLINKDGSLGARNDMACTGIEHKMGLKGNATSSLSFGDNGKCVGYLLGKEREGMKVMFIRAKLLVQKTRCKGHTAVRPLFKRPFAARL